MMNMFMENSNDKKRGRPAGRTQEGEKTRTHLYQTAIALISEVGYESATLREVARRANVSLGLLYRYFPNKRAIVLALYDELSDQFAQRAESLPSGKWDARFLDTLNLSLEVLHPHRVTLRALAPVMVGDTSEGVFAENTEFSRSRVLLAFQNAVRQATNAPSWTLVDPMGRLLYLLHLAVLLWWLLDKSPAQKATTGLVQLFGKTLPLFSVALRLRPIQNSIIAADQLFRDAILSSKVE